MLDSLGMEKSRGDCRALGDFELVQIKTIWKSPSGCLGFGLPKVVNCLLVRKIALLMQKSRGMALDRWPWCLIAAPLLPHCSDCIPDSLSSQSLLFRCHLNRRYNGWVRSPTQAALPPLRIPDGFGLKEYSNARQVGDPTIISRSRLPRLQRLALLGLLGHLYI